MLIDPATCPTESTSDMGGRVGDGPRNGCSTEFHGRVPRCSAVLLFARMINPIVMLGILMNENEALFL